VTDGLLGLAYHLPGEVLLVDTRLDFQWRLLDLETWVILEDVAHGG
jgi:hypothetical protein